ncbi:MAG: PQQ-binding-like beta-propeller repeat protein [Planctomycetes bacterium]|nr:PQQ-binding-like beta-propeller repeat protein [Planctomycetota bacterium]
MRTHTYTRFFFAFVLAAAFAALGAETPPSADWPQSRGPNRDGNVPGGPKLLDAWPKDGPPLLWKSEWIPGCEEGGCSSPVVSDGKVFIYSNAKQPIVPGKPYAIVTPEVLADAGWMTGLPDELAKKLEAAWAAKERPASGFPWWEAGHKDSDLDAHLAKKPELDKFIKDFLATLTPDDAKKYGAFVKRRLCIDQPVKKWGIPDGLSWDILTKLSAKVDERHPYLREWQHVLEKIGITCWLAGAMWGRAYAWSDMVVCLDVATGKELWRKTFTIEQKDLPKDPNVQWWCFGSGGANSVQAIGVCATPAVFKGKCYVAGALGLYCLSAKDGAQVWMVRGDPEHASPLVVNNLVYHVGCAYDLESGKLLWKNPFWDGRHKKYEWTARYWSPTVMVANGKNYIVSSDYKEESNSSFCCLDVESGKSLWTLKSPIGGMVTAAGDILIAPPQYGGSGTKAYKITPAGAELLWKKSIPGVGHVYQDHVYVPAGMYTCVDLKTGEFNWKKPVPGGVCECSGSILADGKIYTPLGEAHQLTKNFGDLTYSFAMIKATPDKFVELGRFNPKICMMSSPAIAGGKLFLRTLDGIACYDLEDHGVYLEAVAAKKDALVFRFKQTGGGLASKDASAGLKDLQLADTAGTRPARAQIAGDEITVDVRDAAVPFSISCAAGALVGKNGQASPAFGWSESRGLKFRKAFDNTLMLVGDQPLQQNGFWNKPETYEITGAKITRIDLDPQGRGVNLITDKTWKPGDALALSFAAYCPDSGEARREKIAATVAEPQRAAAKFVKIDETTAGNWKTVYGSEGAVVAGDANTSAAPKCANVTPLNKNDGIPWAPNREDPRYLVKTGAAKDRTVTSWTAPEQFEIGVEITDGKEHQVALYVLSWGKATELTVEAVDADTGAVLDTQSVKDFVKGKYLLWNVKGQIALRIASVIQQEGTCAIASGVFLDPASAGK